MRFLLLVLMMLCAWALPGANLTMEELREVSAKSTAKEYPDADTILLSDYQVSTYDKDGLGVTIDDYYEKILTEKGRRESRTISMHFSTYYQTIEVAKLEIIRPDGSIVPVDVAANSKVMTEPGQMGSNIYDPNQKVLQVSIPELQIGDIVHTVYKETTIKLRMKGIWTNFNTLQSRSPIHYYEYVVDAPKELPLRSIAVKDEVKDSITFKQVEENGRIVYRWVARSVPQIFSEPAMPPAYMVAQRLLVSTAKDWEEISRWYWEICKPRMEKITPVMKEKVAELVKGQNSDLEKINAIFQFVSKEIRYAGITLEQESPGYEPHDVNITFENRYGVCRDKAALLAALLREAGLDAYPVIFYSGPRKDAEVPNNYFNHAITAVRTAPGKYILMDSTNETTPEIFPSYLSNMSYLVAVPEGDTLRTSPVVPPDQNKLTIATNGKLDAEGTLTATSLMTFGGINDDAYRGAFSSWRPEQVRQFVTQQLRRAVAGAVLDDLKLLPTDLRDMSKPLQLEIKFSAKNFPVQGANEALFTPPWLGSNFGVVNFVLGFTGLKERQYPMQIFSTCSSEEKFNIELPADFTLDSLPEYKAVSDEILDWKQNMELKERTITGNGYMAFKYTEVSPTQYITLKDSLRNIEYESLKTPIFKIVRPESELIAEANAVYQDWDVVFDIKDAMNWTKTEKVRKQVLRFGGIRSNSELKFSYNPAWGEVKLIKATVIQPDGSRQEVTDKEINIMDEGWVGGAPRYPAGKTMVVNLPGVRVGSIIEYEVQSTTKNLTPFAMLAVFQEQDPIMKKTVKVNSAIKLEPKADDGLTSTVKDNQYSWTAEKVPGFKSETAMPPSWIIAPSVQIFADKLNNYGNTVLEALEKAVTPVDIAMIKGKDEQEKIKEIRDFVAINIRDAGPAFTSLPLSSLTPAEKTLRDGYGNSADRAVLIASMLKADGIKYQFVLASNLPSLPGSGWRDVFLPGLYDQVLVKTGDIYLNDTDQYTPLEARPHGNRLAFTLDNSAIPLNPILPSRDREYMTYHIAVQLDGSADIKVEKNYTGMLFAGKNRFYAELTPELRKRHEQDMVTSISENAEAIEPLKVELLAHSVLKETISVKVKRFAVKTGKYMQFNLPGSIVNSLIRPLPVKRIYPYFINNSNDIWQMYRISLPAETRVIRMTPKPLYTNFVQIGTTEKRNNLEITIIGNFNPALIAPSEYPGLQGVQTLLSHPSMNTVLFELE